MECMHDIGRRLVLADCRFSERYNAPDLPRHFMREFQNFSDGRAAFWTRSFICFMRTLREPDAPEQHEQTAEQIRPGHDRLGKTKLHRNRDPLHEVRLYGNCRLRGVWGL